MTYLKMPLQLQSAVAKKLQSCSYQESIALHIMLLILSHHGEVIGREDFGSMIWDLEFNQLVKISDWEEGVKNSLIKTIEKYEKRLRNVDVNVTLLEIEEENIDKVSHIRRKAQITVTGIMDRTNEKFSFNTSLYISPLSHLSNYVRQETNCNKGTNIKAGYGVLGCIRYTRYGPRDRFAA